MFSLWLLTFRFSYAAVVKCLCQKSLLVGHSYTEPISHVLLDEQRSKDSESGSATDLGKVSHVRCHIPEALPMIWHIVGALLFLEQVIYNG